MVEVKVSAQESAFSPPEKRALDDSEPPVAE